MSSDNDDLTRLAQERLAFLKFMRQVLTPLPPETLNNVNEGDDDGVIRDGDGDK